MVRRRQNSGFLGVKILRRSMTELPWASPSAVAVVETSTHFMVERRPDLPGRLAYPGRIGLFGGHIDNGESAEEAILRELREELGLRRTPNDLSHLWRGVIESQVRDGTPAWRHVDVFRTQLGDDVKLDMKIGGEIVRIAKAPAAVECHIPRMTRFTRNVLERVMRGEPMVNISGEAMTA